MCGRLVEKKGFSYGIEAFAKCFKKHRNIRLQIIGDGPLKYTLKELIKNLELEDVILLLGNKSHDEVAEVLKKAEILMMPYATPKNGDSEGIPYIIKEAIATGLPVISTKHAGVPEAIEDGKTGFLVDEKDIDALTNKLNYLIENPDLWAKFGIRGRKVVENKFDITKLIQNLEEIYRSLIYQ